MEKFHLYLVRSMRRRSSYCCGITLLLLTSCGTDLHVVGARAAAISDSDLQQIKDLIIQRHVDKPTIFIRPLSADYARVQSGRSDYDGAQYYVFTLAKRSGRWQILEQDLSPWRTVITH